MNQYKIFNGRDDHGGDLPQDIYYATTTLVLEFFINAHLSLYQQRLSIF